MRAIKNVCGRVFILHHGEKIADGTVEENLMMGAFRRRRSKNIQLTLDNSHYGCVLSTGRVEMEGSSQELLGNREIKEIYLGL